MRSEQRRASASSSKEQPPTEPPQDIPEWLEQVRLTVAFLEDLATVEPLAPAFIRGIQAKQRLIEEHGGAITAEQVASALGMTRQAVEGQRRAGLWRARSCLKMSTPAALPGPPFRSCKQRAHFPIEL